MTENVFFRFLGLGTATTALSSVAKETVARMATADAVLVGAAYGIDAASDCKRQMAQTAPGWAASVEWARVAGPLSDQHRMLFALTAMVESRGKDVISATGDVSPIQLNRKTFPKVADAWEARRDPRILGTFFVDYMRETSRFMERITAKYPWLAGNATASYMLAKVHYNASPATASAVADRMEAARSGHGNWAVGLVSYGTPNVPRRYPLSHLMALYSLAEE